MVSEHWQNEVLFSAVHTGHVDHHIHTSGLWKTGKVEQFGKVMELSFCAISHGKTENSRNS